MAPDITTTPPVAATAARTAAPASTQRLALHWPAAGFRRMHFCIVAWNPGMLEPFDTSTSGPVAVGSGKSGTPLARMH